LLNSDNFSVYEVKRIAHEDMKRRWAHRARQERLLLQQEGAIREHVHKVTMAITGRCATRSALFVAVMHMKTRF
jgi:hypothetical protein